MVFKSKLFFALVGLLDMQACMCFKVFCTLVALNHGGCAVADMHGRLCPLLLGCFSLCLGNHPMT